MDDATQKLVGEWEQVVSTEGLRRADALIRVVSTGGRLRDALEAAQRRAEEDHAEANRLVNEYAVKAGNLALALKAAYDQMESFVEAGLLSRINGQYEPSASMIAALEAAQRPPVNPVVEAIDAARDSIARGELASVVIDTDDYPQRPPVSENVRDLVDDLRESAAQSYEELSQVTIDVLNRAADYISRPPVSLDVREAGIEAATVAVEGLLASIEKGSDHGPRDIAEAALDAARWSFPSQPVYNEESK